MKRNKIFIYISVCKGLSNNDGGRARGGVFQEIRPGSHFKIGETSLIMKFGGVTAERLILRDERNMQANKKIEEFYGTGAKIYFKHYPSLH